MSYAKSRQTEIEGCAPHGNRNSQTHLRFEGDYKTFCGRECTDWPKSDAAHRAVVSPWCCKRCYKAYYK